MAITNETLQLSADARAALLSISDGHIRKLVQAWINTWDELGEEFDASLNELMTLADDGGYISKAKVARNTRLANTLDLALTRLEELADSVEVTIGGDLHAVMRQAYESQAAMVASQLPAGQASIVATWDRSTAAAVDAMVARALEQIHKDTRPLAADVVRSMKTELVKGIALGDNPRTTARRIIKRTEGRFNGGLTRAMTIARTELIDSHRAAGRLSDESNGDILEGWRWSADLSARTCPSCIANHGSMHPATEAGPLDHQNGRCARVPVTKSWAELGFTGVTEPADTFPDARGWFQNLTPDTQVAIMGKERLSLLQSGAVSFDDLTVRKSNGQWRDSMTVRPVKTLRPKAS